MKVHLTSEQEALIREAIRSGRVKNAEDAMHQALLLWEERERRRAEILAALDSAQASLARGEGRPITEESIRQVAEEVKARGRARLDAEQPPRP